MSETPKQPSDNDLPSDSWGEPGRCDLCGNRRTVILAPDPYLDEVYPESPNPELWWCQECYSDRKDEV